MTTLLYNPYKRGIAVTVTGLSATVTTTTLTMTATASANLTFDIRYNTTNTFSGSTSAGSATQGELSAGKALSGSFTVGTTYYVFVAYAGTSRGSTSATATYDITQEPYYDAVTLLLHAESLTTDSSRYGATISNSGASLSTSIKKFGSSSYLFNGSSEINTTNSSNYAFGSGDFTIEAWWYYSSTTYNKFIGNQRSYGRTSFGNGNWGLGIAFPNGTNAAYFGWKTSGGTAGGFQTANGTVPLNAWTHIAVTRFGNTLTIYINGVSSATASISGSIDYGSSNILSIGSIGSTEFITGYVDDLRVTKGFARYATNFIVPQAPFGDAGSHDTNFNNVTLLLHGDSTTTDTSPLAATITNSDTLLSTTIKKFGTGSFNFNGNQWLSTPSSTDYSFGIRNFTIEFWMYPSANVGRRIAGTSAGTWQLNNWQIGLEGSSKLYFNNNNSAGGTLIVGTSTIPTGSWTHGAIVRSGTSLTVFVNGVSETTTTISESLSIDNGVAATILIGQGGVTTDNKWNGYVDDFRVTKGVARYTTNFRPPIVAFPDAQVDINYKKVVTLLQGEIALTTNNSNAVVDTSLKGTLFTNNISIDPVAINTTTKKFGTGSMYFSRVAIMRSPYASTDYALGSGDFTIEFWLYLPENYQLGNYQYMSTMDTSWVSGNWIIRTNNTGSSNSIAFIGNTQFSTVGWGDAGVVTFNEWQHIAFTRNGTALLAFRNGSMTTYSSYFTANPNLDTNACFLNIGGTNPGNTASYIKAYIDDFRITKGLARYTANFTPPLCAFPNTDSPQLYEYPPAAMTGNTTTFTGLQYGNGAYTASASSLLNTSGNYDPWRAFDKVYITGGNLECICAANSYNSSTGAYSSGVTTTISTVASPGEWLQFQFPSSIQIVSYYIQVYEPTNAPSTWKLAGSTDGSTWFLLDSQASQTSDAMGRKIIYNVTSNFGSYRYYRIVVNKIVSTGGSTSTIYGHWGFYSTTAL
jgi:hypothetical protein